MTILVSPLSRQRSHPGPSEVGVDLKLLRLEIVMLKIKEVRLPLAEHGPIPTALARMSAEGSQPGELAQQRRKPRKLGCAKKKRFLFK